MAGRLFKQMESASAAEAGTAQTTTEEPGVVKVATAHTSVFARAPESDYDSLVKLPGQGAPGPFARIPSFVQH